ncbi:MAG: hypothetical protein JRI89_03810 [Deltaproteobacteria bacterium]|nr:hypothetical protein [Deltaproteobacteria bacterium]
MKLVSAPHAEVFPGCLERFLIRTRHLRALELAGQERAARDVRAAWQESLHNLAAIYQEIEQQLVVAEALTDPYFPLNKLGLLNIENFTTDPRSTHLSQEQLSEAMIRHLYQWAVIFLTIRRDIRALSRSRQIGTMSLTGSPAEQLPEAGWCDYCGCCCEIPGGLPEFSGGFAPPQQWLFYYNGDGCTYQRFCPFLFEYFASGRFFCSIYLVKPVGCWAFDREECSFLKRDLAREGVAGSAGISAA